MKVKDLVLMLQDTDPESDILVRIDGSIYPTDNIDEHLDYNHESQNTFYVLALENFLNE